MVSKTLLNKGKFWTRGPVVVSGCSHVSEGCDHCWSQTAHKMRMHYPPVEHIYSKKLISDGKFNGKVQVNLQMLRNAVKGKKPQVIAIWNDLYHEGVTDSQIYWAYRLMAKNRHHTYLIITKRPQRAVNVIHKIQHLTAVKKIENINIWHIVTMENQARMEERMPHLLNIPGRRGIIIEPMLGHIDLINASDMSTEDDHGNIVPWMDEIHQVILGGETGPGARPIYTDFVRYVREQCRFSGVPFYFKSWGNYKGPEVFLPRAGRLLDGREHNDLAWVI